MNHIVGAGFAGSVGVCALADAGSRAPIIDKRRQIGRSAYYAYTPPGVLIHPDGPISLHRVDHRNIPLQLDIDYFTIRGDVGPRHAVPTGPSNAVLDLQLGHLSRPRVNFEQERLPALERCPSQGTVYNLNEHLCMRTTDFTHLPGEHHAGTSIVREHLQAHGDPSRPIQCPESNAQFNCYEMLTKEPQGITFVGRVTPYRHCNMDRVVGPALVSVQNWIGSGA